MSKFIINLGLNSETQIKYVWYDDFYKSGLTVISAATTERSFRQVGDLYYNHYVNTGWVI